MEKKLSKLKKYLIYAFLIIGFFLLGYYYKNNSFKKKEGTKTEQHISQSTSKIINHAKKGRSEIERLERIINANQTGAKKDSNINDILRDAKAIRGGCEEVKIFLDENRNNISQNIFDELNKNLTNEINLLSEIIERNSK